MNTNEASPFAVTAMKLAQYRNRHNGKPPARIFVSNMMLLELSRTSALVRTDDMESMTERHKIFGIPACVFDSCDRTIYLSDEEAWGDG